MDSVHEILTEQFRQWESRGRGWRVFDEPVAPEPPFAPFYGYHLPTASVIDDGRRPTILSSFMQKLSQRLGAPPPAPPVVPEEEPEPEPERLIREALVEFQTSLPAKLDISREAFVEFLSSVSLCREPVTFELLGTAGRVNVQFVASEADAPLIRRQLQAYFSEATFLPRQSTLEQTWESCEGSEMLAVEFGLAREFMFQLASGKLDPFVGLVGALSELEPSELGLFQVIFQPVQEEWADSILRSVTDAEGRPFFVNEPELAGAAENKIQRPLYAAVVRIAAKGKIFDRVLQIARDMAGSLRVFAQPKSNELIPLSNEEYPFDEHIEDVLRRQSRRSGMILNCDELTGFVHLPSSAVRSPALVRDTAKTKAAPAIVRNSTGLLLGHNLHAGQSIPVRLTPQQRVQHCHIIGASGTGKSTLLFNLIRQDIENGEGVALLDPHGDLVDKVLGIIPSHRIDDVVLVDPSDPNYSVAFNILSAHSELEKDLLASDLVSVFQRLSTSWGDQMHSVLQNAILAFLESSRPGTIADLRRFLVESSFRSEFLKSVQDPNVLYYWHNEFPRLRGDKSIGPILTRLTMLLAKKPLCHMVSQPENRLDFGQIMDTGKIFLAKLPEGLLGEENSHLIGALLIAKFQQMAMSRQAQQIATRRDLWIYIDEFANFITPSMAKILSGARKYRIGLILAHHELQQLARSPDVASAITTHPLTRIVFHVGDDDAKKLGDSFSYFEARDLKNLETFHAICRVERSDFDFNLSIALPDTPDDTATAIRRQEVIAASRQKYGTPRAQVEAMLRQAWGVGQPTSTTTKVKPPREPAPVPEPPPITVVIPAPPPVLPTTPSVAELPKTMVVPPDPVVPPEVTPPVIAEVPKPPRKQGRGGPLHQTMQKDFQRIARGMGFTTAKIEDEISDGSKRCVDLLLKRGDVVIACEFPFTNSVPNEVENIAKCLQTGLPLVAVVCEEPKHLDKIRAAAFARLGSVAADRVGYFSRDEFIAELTKIATETPTGAANREVIGDHTVTEEQSQLSPAELKARNENAIKVIAAFMRQRKK
jgi:Type IV secretion-system coupling protein DNA-binding domain